MPTIESCWANTIDGILDPLVSHSARNGNTPQSRKGTEQRCRIGLNGVSRYLNGIHIGVDSIIDTVNLEVIAIKQIIQVKVLPIVCARISAIRHARYPQDGIFIVLFGKRV